MKKMYKVAIVEDNACEREALKACLVKFGKANDLSFFTNSYGDIENFIGDYKNDYDIIFLDIELPGKNGMDGAKLIREKDSEVAIFFVTHIVHFATQGYEVNATDYVVKPIVYASFEVKMSRILQRLSSRQGKSIVMSSKETVYRFNDREIIYIEVMGHKLFFHLVDTRIVELTGSLVNMEEKLKDSGFARCKSCFLVNMKYIVSVKKKKIFLFNGEELEITRERKKDFMDAFFHYCANME